MRNRGYVYWRMLSEDPEAAKKVVLCTRPKIRIESSGLDPHVRDKLLTNLSMLASVYFKTPDQFVRKLRDTINERADLETQDL